MRLRITIAAACAAWLIWAILVVRPAPAESSESRQFTFFHEFYGHDGHADPQLALNLEAGMMNGVVLWPPVEQGATKLAGQVGSLMLRLAGGAGPAGMVAGDIERERAAFAALSLPQPGLLWNLLPEWDQSGGKWVPAGRPSYKNLSRQVAHRRFLSHYEGSYPELLAELARPRSERGSYLLTATTDYSPNVSYAYELGVDLQLLERGIDELGDLSTGIAYVRGAARQAGKPWGIDISTWRTSNNGATNYDAAGRLTGGWSAGYLERIYYLAFAAGAHVIQNEPANYRTPRGSLNELGEVTREFSDFALRRHPDIGAPTVNAALLIDHFSGFDPKHGIDNQASAVWYRDIPYSAGDYMAENVMRLAYPDHWLHGLTPGAPFANSRGVPDRAAFARFLADGGDPRPYEPMPTTRWGDNLDVITTRVPAGALANYRVIVLVGEVALDDRLRAALSDWVERGGVLVINATQFQDADAELFGVELAEGAPKPGTGSRWLAGGQLQQEPPFLYRPVRTTTAEVAAVSESGAPLITSRFFGKGEALLTTPLHLQSDGRDRLLEVGMQLLDSVIARFEPVRVEGPPIEYVVGRPANKIVVTIANHQGENWEGRIVIPRQRAPYLVSDYRSDEPIEHSISDSEIKIALAVKPYSVRVIGIECPKRK